MKNFLGLFHYSLNCGDFSFRILNRWTQLPVKTGANYLMAPTPQVPQLKATLWHYFSIMTLTSNKPQDNVSKANRSSLRSPTITAYASNNHTGCWSSEFLKIMILPEMLRVLMNREATSVDTEESFCLKADSHSSADISSSTDLWHSIYLSRDPDSE